MIRPGLKLQLLVLIKKRQQNKHIQNIKKPVINIINKIINESWLVASN